MLTTRSYKHYGVLLLLSVVIICVNGLLHPWKSYAQQRSSTTAAANYSWQPVILKKGKLIQVGDQRLPEPLVFPEDLVPLENKALLVQHLEYPGRLRFYLYYPADQEKQLQQWVMNFPEHTTSGHNIFQRTKFYTYSNLHSYLLYAKVRDSSLVITERYWPQNITYAMTGDDRSLRELVNSMNAPNSPLVHTHGFIALGILFSPLHTVKARG